jgi:hypothetical protein
VKRIILLLVSASLIAVSCKHHKEEVPSYVIPEERLVPLLVDYHLAQAISNTYPFRQRTQTYSKLSLCDSVIVAHGYTRKIFDSTMLYYSKNIEKFDALYEKVITELNRMQAKNEGRQILPNNNKKAKDKEKIKEKKR